ncbi:MAG: hypothetical protein QOG23_3137 [Blastocatellia bacterium]|jgi:hypothetical protein|nr:hypothetical protein [Blastocatellia bacterium]
MLALVLFGLKSSGQQSQFNDACELQPSQTLEREITGTESHGL